MGKLWDLIEQHRDAQAYPPTYRRISQELGVSQSLFDTWKAPKRLPTRHNIEAIARVVGVSYQTVLEAALDDTRYRIPPSRDEKDGEEHDQRSAPTKQARESRVGNEEMYSVLFASCEQAVRAAAEEVETGVSDRLFELATSSEYDTTPQLGWPRSGLGLTEPDDEESAVSLQSRVGRLLQAAGTYAAVASKEGVASDREREIAQRLLRIMRALDSQVRTIVLELERERHRTNGALERALGAAAFETTDDLDAEVEGQQQEP